MAGSELLHPAVFVSCVKVLVVVSKRKISRFPSAFPGAPGVRSRVDAKVIRVPAALMVGVKLLPPAVFVSWVKMNGCACPSSGHPHPTTHASTMSSMAVASLGRIVTSSQLEVAVGGGQFAAPHTAGPRGPHTTRLGRPV